jgi:acyl carrier protein
MTDATHVEQKIKQFVLQEFLPGEDPENLTTETPLVTTGVLDSIATLQLVEFLEREFDISVAPHETDAENLDTIGRIAALVRSKDRGAAG